MAEIRTLNLNEATVDEIVEADVEQVDEERAEDLVRYRDEHGPFRSWDDVKCVPGFSDRMVQNLREAGATLGEEE